MSKLSDSEKARYSRFMALPEMGKEGQYKLKEAKVLVIGAGGLGSAVLPILAAAGVGTIGIVEDETVELSNMQRQTLYSPEEEGFKKLNIVRSHLQKMNPELQIKVFDTRFKKENSKEIARQFDVVADCTDNFPSRFLINDVCAELEKTLIYASVNDYEGQVMVLHHKKKTTLRDIYPDIPREQSNNAILPTLPQIIGAIQSNECLKAITGKGNILDGQLLVFNVLTNDFHIVNV